MSNPEGEAVTIKEVEYRDFIKALTPEKAVQYMEWEEIANDLPDNVVEAWKIIGQRIRFDVSQGFTRRALMTDIEKALDETLYGCMKVEHRTSDQIHLDEIEQLCVS